MSLTKTSGPPLADDLLHGAKAIAEYLFGDADKVQKVTYLVRKRQIPVFWTGKNLHARKSELKRKFSTEAV